jgi:hypothetical protein
MAVWFQIALALNVIYWAVFFYLLSRRRRDVPALAAGLFHMLFAAAVSVAPIRSLLDPDYVGYGLGVLHFEKRAVALPAALILGWALTAAWVAVGQGRGRWMRLVLAGDLFFALSMGVSILLDGSRNWKFQLGEHFTATGAAGLLILLCLFTLPFIASAVWAAGRTRAGGTAPPPASNAREGRESAKQGGKNTNSYRYAESRV